MKHSFKNLLMVILTLVSLVINAVRVTPAHAAINWEMVGTAGFSAGQADYTSLAVYNGTPYVAYKDLDNDNKATVMKFDGTNWVLVGMRGFSAGQADYTSLALDSSGTPYVAYRDGANINNKATVMKFNGTSSSWEVVGTAGFSAGQADYTSLALDSSGTPYVAYKDLGTGNKATVMKFNGTSSTWEVVGTPGFSAGTADYTSLALDSSGTPYVAYRDGFNAVNRATVMKFNGTSSTWEVVGTARFSGVADYTSLALDSSGTPYVAYRDWSSFLHATVMKFNGTSSTWEVVGTPGFSAGQADYTSLVVHNGTPYVAYEDLGNGSRTTVMKFNGTSSTWGVVVAAGFSAGQAAYTSLAVENSTPYVAYKDLGTGNNGKATVMRYTGDAPLHTVTFDANATIGVSGSMSPQSAYSPTALTPNAFTRAGYTFIGWNTAPNGLGIFYANGAQYHFVADITLYAQWAVLPPRTVTFRANGGTGFMLKQITNTPTLLTPNAFTRAGYDFNGWNTAPNGSGTAYADGVEYNFLASIILYAQWNAISNALDFDGVDDYVSIASMPALNDFTLEYWLYPRSPDGSPDFITYTQGDIFNTAKDDSGNIWVYEPSLGWVPVTNTTLDDWTHLAFVRSGTTLTVYKNGEEVFNNNNVSATPLSSQWCFGGKCDSGEFGNMRLDEVRIWKVARSEAEIQAKMNSEVSPQDDLVAYYKFNQGEAGEDNAGVTTAIDRSGWGVNGDLNNFALDGDTSNWVAGMALAAAPGIAIPTINSLPNPTNNPTPTVTGTAAAGNWVEVWYHDSSMIDPNHWELVCDLLVDVSSWSCAWPDPPFPAIAEGPFWLGAVAHVGNEYGENIIVDVDSVLDLTAPETQIDSHPDNPTTIVDATFTFSSPDPTATFECQLDGGGFSACADADSQDYSDLADGSHTFEVRAKDAAGNVDDTPASYTWTITVDTTVPPVNAGIYDDAHAAWIYTGNWASYSGSGPSGNTLHYTSTIGDSAELTFTGTKFTLLFTKDSNRGSIDVFVDEDKITTIDAYAASPAFQQTYTSPTFANGDHTVSLVHAGGRPYIDVDAITIFEPVAVGTYDDMDSNWFYTGAWAVYNGSGPSGNTLHHTSTVGSAAELTFTGTKFTLLFTKDSNRGSIDVFVDEDKITTIDAYAASPAFQQTYTSPTFANGDHTVSLVHAGGRPYMDIDAIHIFGTPVAAGTYDDMDSNWFYTGAWAVYNGSGPSGNTLHYTSTVGSAAELTFTGTKFALTLTKDSNRGLIDVFVDGNKVTTIDAYSASPAFQQTYTSPTFANGDHTVSLVHAGGSIIDVDAITIFEPVAAGTYDDMDSNWFYTGAWAVYNGSGPSGNTLHYTSTVGDSAEFVFTGTKFTLLFTKDFNRGLIDVFVDEDKITTIDAYSASYAFQQTYTSPTFANGNHTVSLVHAGGRPYMDIDAIHIFGTPVAAGTYDNMDSNWFYTGAWAVYNGSGPSGNTLHYTSTVGDSADFVFTGTQFSLLFTKDSNRGSIDVFVDEDKITTIDAYSASPAFQQTYISPSFTAGDHTVSLVHAGGRPYIDIDAITIFGTPVSTGTYDDMDSNWVYTSAWAVYNGSGPYNNTLHYTSTAGSSAELLFTGTKFTLLFTRDSNRGALDVFVDGNKIATIDGYLGAFAFQQLYTSPSFPNGTHTVRLVFTGGRPYFDIDAIQIFGVPVTVTAGIYDDGHAAWRYSGGWASYTGNGPYGNTLHYNGTAGNYAELTFTGRQFTLLFTKDSNRGSMDVYVDGNKVTTINAYSPTYAYQQTYTSPTFANGTHTVYVVHAGTGPYIDVDAITILP